MLVFFDKFSFLIATLVSIQSGEAQAIQQDGFEMLRNGKVFNRFQQNWDGMDVRENSVLGMGIAGNDVAAQDVVTLLLF